MVEVFEGADYVADLGIEFLDLVVDFVVLLVDLSLALVKVHSHLLDDEVPLVRDLVLFQPVVLFLEFLHPVDAVDLIFQVQYLVAR